MATGQLSWHAYELLFPNGMSALHSLEFTNSSKCLYDIISIPKKVSRSSDKQIVIGWIKNFTMNKPKLKIQFRVHNVKE